MASIEQFAEATKERLIANFAEAMIDLHSDMNERIFVKLKDKDNGDPKEYSKDPISVQAPPKGIPREAGRKSKSGKTRYFEGGYNQLKGAIGRPPMKLFGNLETSFSNGLRKINDFEFQIIVPKEDANKVERHFKRFFYPSKEELQKAQLRILE